ncbi:MAG: MerR family transcriptional regulator [Cardiobacterium sp.]
MKPVAKKPAVTGEKLQGEALLWRYARQAEDAEGESDHVPGCPCCSGQER